MPKVSFTQNIQRYVECPSMDADGKTVGELLNRVFEKIPRARGYVLDEHGMVRRHMVIFLDGDPISDRENLSDPVKPDSEVYVMQALSGG